MSHKQYGMLTYREFVYDIIIDFMKMISVNRWVFGKGHVSVSKNTHIQQWMSTQWSFIKLFSDRNWLGIFLRVPSTLILKVEHRCALLWYDDCLSQEWDVTILGHIVIKQQYNN